jgi:hypothetical protein
LFNLGHGSWRCLDKEAYNLKDGTEWNSSTWRKVEMKRFSPK